jgi:hypothetical protein
VPENNAVAELEVQTLLSQMAPSKKAKGST